MKIPTISQRIEGTPKERMLHEFFMNSGLFQIFLITHIVISEGVKDLIRDPANYLLLISAIFQTWIIERYGRKTGWKNALFLLVAPTTYTVLDIAREGFVEFQNSPYHWIYWSFSILLALFTFWRSVQPSLVSIQIVLTSILRTLLFPALYFTVETLSLEGVQGFTKQEIIAYWSIPGHAYILVGSIIFGLLIGVSEASRNRSLILLQNLAKRLQEVIGWSFDETFTETAVANIAHTHYQKVEKIIFFMDIRGFTKWSETHELHDVTEMLNSYYETVEQHIIEAGGAKPQFTGDEVMTWFTPDSDLFERIQTLQKMTIDEMKKHDLAVGIGVHFGEVVEGLIGSSTTKGIRITGDPVNTCARICNAASSGELLVSEEACLVLSLATEYHMERSIVAKGKKDPLKVFSFSTPDASGSN